MVCSESHIFNLDRLFLLNGENTLLNSKCKHLNHTIKTTTFGYSNIIYDLQYKANRFFKQNSILTKITLK